MGNKTFNISMDAKMYKALSMMAKMSGNSVASIIRIACLTLIMTEGDEMAIKTLRGDTISPNKSKMELYNEFVKEDAKLKKPEREEPDETK